MKITFLGTGTSQGVPVIACECNICTSTNSKDKRLRTSILIEKGNTTVVIDSGPDFRQQMLTANVKKLDAIVFTHEHKDHVAGLDDVRAFNYKYSNDMPVYGNTNVEAKLKKEFDYIFEQSHIPGVPRINYHVIDQKPFTIGDITFTPIHVRHAQLPVLGFRIDDFVYITDANFIAEKEFAKLKNVGTLVLNALRKESHLSHFTLQQALEMTHKINPKCTYFTHISHQLGKHNDVLQELPNTVTLAYDGLSIFIK